MVSGNPHSVGKDVMQPAPRGRASHDRQRREMEAQDSEFAVDYCM